MNTRPPNRKMSMLDENAGSIVVSNLAHQDDEAWVIDSIATATPPPPTSARIHRVPRILVSETDAYDKYYVPKIVSIGPYHYGNQELELFEKLKPVFTMKLLSNNKGLLKSLYRKLGEENTVQELRSFYEEKSTDQFCDKKFIRMMLLDGCFILYYIQFIFGTGGNKSSPDLKSHQIVFLHQDLFLLENQIPSRVLNEVIKLLVNYNWRDKIMSFIEENILASERPKRRWLCGMTKNDRRSKEETEGGSFNFSDDHLLQFLHGVLTKHESVQERIQTTNGCTYFGSKCVDQPISRCTFRNVNELIDVGIRFKPSSIMSLAHIEYSGSWWWFLADIKLPPITVDDSTKPMLLNLIAHEMCSDKAQEAWVTSYICLLDSLIDHPEDVKALRKAGVLVNSLGSDKEVAKLFNEIGTDLVPNSSAYSGAKTQIQHHYDSLRNTRLSQLKHEYVKSPWAFLALVGAVLALVLSGVQTYFTVWSPESVCDGFCKFLKNNHHL